MSSFQKTPNEFQRLDYRLLQNGAVTMYLRKEFLGEDLIQLEKYGYQIYNFDCLSWKTIEDAYKSFSRILKFPDYFGYNLDALSDCLIDLEVPEKSGIVLVFRRYDAFSFSSDVAWNILDTIERISRHHLLFGRRFFVLVQTDDPLSRFDNLGGQPASWNWREFLSSNRGL